MYWHWRTPKVTPYRFLMNSASPLPSHRPLAIPTDSGSCRRTDPISSICSSLSRRGRPTHSLSTRPAKPLSSKRWTKYSTVLGESLRRRLTSGQLIPWATTNTPWRRWSYRNSFERWISSCDPSTTVDASVTVKGFMKIDDHKVAPCAIMFCVMYNQIHDMTIQKTKPES